MPRCQFQSWWFVTRGANSKSPQHRLNNSRITVMKWWEGGGVSAGGSMRAAPVQKGDEGVILYMGLRKGCAPIGFSFIECAHSVAETGFIMGWAGQRPNVVVLSDLAFDCVCFEYVHGQNMVYICLCGWQSVHVRSFVPWTQRIVVRSNRRLLNSHLRGRPKLGCQSAVPPTDPLCRRRTRKPSCVQPHLARTAFYISLVIGVEANLYITDTDWLYIGRIFFSLSITRAIRNWNSKN